MLKYRLPFGIAMVIALIALIWGDDRIGAVNVEGTFLASWLGQPELRPGILVFGIFLLLITVGAGELVNIFHAKGIKANAFVVRLAGLVGFAMFYVMPGDLNGPAALAFVGTPIAVVFLAALVAHAAHKQPDGAVAAGGAALFGLVYMGMMPGFYLLVRAEFSAWIIMAIIITTKNCDTGAYTFGRMFGKHKLIFWLSPGKTWEGLAGGVAFSALTGVLLAAIANGNDIPLRVDTTTGELVAMDIPLWYAAIAGALLGLIGHGGDLIASLFKRDAGIKDSGNTIPGFGGVLDVCDSPIVVAPLGYWLLQASVIG